MTGRYTPGPILDTSSTLVTLSGGEGEREREGGREGGSWRGSWRGSEWGGRERGREREREGGREGEGVGREMYLSLLIFFIRFNLSQANLNDANLDKMEPSTIPDIVRQHLLTHTLTHTHFPRIQVLIKKSYGDRQKRSKQRNWQLQMIDREMDAAMATANQDTVEQDYQEFLEDLEEDMEYRRNINIFFSEWVWVCGCGGREGGDGALDWKPDLNCGVLISEVVDKALETEKCPVYGVLFMVSCLWRCPVYGVLFMVPCLWRCPCILCRPLATDGYRGRR